MHRIFFFPEKGSKWNALLCILDGLGGVGLPEQQDLKQKQMETSTKYLPEESSSQSKNYESAE